MREILFRGFTPDKNGRGKVYINGEWIKGQWVKGSYMSIDKTTYCFKEDYDKHPDNTEHYIIFDQMTDWGLPNRHLQADVLPETVGQYTGLMANGKEIFEGDIVESRASENKEDWKYWQVIFYDGSYCFEKDNPHKRKYKYEQNLLSEDEIELYGLVVVGNIYDNPELLKGVRE